MTLISKIYQVCHRWINLYKIHLKVSPSFSSTSSKSILLVQMFIGLTRSVAMIFGSADPSASIPISVGPATCSKRSMPHIYSSRVWFSRKKLTWSIPHLPKSCRLASATNLFPGPTARCFFSIFCIHIWHLSWNIGDFCTNYLRWEIQYLWDLPLSLWTNQRQEQQFPGKMNWKVCPKWCSDSSFPIWDLNSSKSKDMRGAGIFEGVQCCRVNLSGLFADYNQSDWRPKNFH